MSPGGNVLYVPVVQRTSTISSPGQESLSDVKVI